MKRYPQPVSQEENTRRRITPTFIGPRRQMDLNNANMSMLGGNMRDPIQYRHRKERYIQSAARREKYGMGTMQDVQRRAAAARFDPDSAAYNFYNNQIMNRLNEGFVGRGRYKRRGYRGRGMYTSGMKGRGMYTSGMQGRGRYQGRGSFWKNLRKGVASTARWGAKHYDDVMPYVEGGLALTGPQGAAAAAGLASQRSNIKTGLKVIGGRGAYNTLFPELGPEPISFESSQSEHGNLVVSGSEKVFDVYGNSLLPGEDPTSLQAKCEPFTTIAIDLYPGNFEHFPKLAQHAADFKEYEFVQMIFVYKSTIAANWSTEAVTTGKVIMATQMDVNRPVWTTYDELASVENKTEGLVTGTTDDDRMHTHGIECDPKNLTSKGLKFVRTKGLTGQADKNDYDLGRFQFGMFGSGANLADQMIGELWVQYKVVFKNHRMYSMLGLNIPQSIWKKPLALTAGPGDTNNNYTAIWPQVLDFNDTNKCDFNNLDILMENTNTTSTPAGPSGQSFMGIEKLITFPSNLRGDFELEIQYCGSGLLVNPASTYGASTLDTNTQRPMQYWNYVPTLTGTVQLNQDFPISSTSIDGNTYGTSTQSSSVVLMGDSMVSLRYHIHLGQATSTQENTMTVFVPFYLFASSAGAIGLENLQQQFAGSALVLKQYNACQLIGSSGFPYSSLN